jgi:hypothetical protein
MRFEPRNRQSVVGQRWREGRCEPGGGRVRCPSRFRGHPLGRRVRVLVRPLLARVRWLFEYVIRIVYRVFKRLVRWLVRRFLG